MKRLLGLALVLCMAQAAVSEIYQSEPNPSQKYQSMTIGEINSAGGYQVGDKLFSDFSCVPYTSGPEAYPPVCDEIVVTGLDANGDYGITFNASWYAGAGSTVNSTLKFKVLVVPSSDNYIVGSTFRLEGAGVSGNGFIDAIENIYPIESGLVGTNEAAALNVFKKPSGNKLVDSSDFYNADGSPAMLKEIWIVKDISMNGLSGSVHLSSFTQTFHQIPEPASMGMLGSGIVVAMLRRSRTRKSSRKEAKVDDFSPIKSMALAGSVDAPYGSMTGEAYVYGGRKVEAEHSNF